MILPIYAYGNPVLKQKAATIDPNYPQLDDLIKNMYETMYNASGVGLAAPQVGLSIRLFVVDGEPMMTRDDVHEDLTDFQKVFINPTILEESGDKWGFEEGCLSIPNIRDTVQRKSIIKIHYYTPAWEEVTETLSGMRARIVQHEYDHIEGVLFTDYASAFKKQLNWSKLQKIAKGKVSPDYPMKFVKG